MLKHFIIKHKKLRSQKLCAFDSLVFILYKFPSAALSSIAVARYGSFFRLADRKFILRYLTENQ